MYQPIVDEIALLLDKISASEAFIDKAEEYYRTHKHMWSDGVAAYFEVFLERKREQVYFEENLLEHLGWRAALEPEVPDPDIAREEEDVQDMRTVFIGESTNEEKIVLYQPERYPLDEFHIRVDDGEVWAISPGSAMRVVGELEDGMKVMYVHIESPEWSGVAKGYTPRENG